MDSSYRINLPVRCSPYFLRAGLIGPHFTQSLFSLIFEVLNKID